MARIWFVAAIAAAVQAAVSRDGNHAPVSGRQHALRMRGGAWGRARSRDRHGGCEPERGLEACRERGGADFPAGNADEVERQLRRRLHVNELDLAAALYLGDVLHLVRSDADGAAACFEHVLESDPRNIHAMGSYALVLLRERCDYERAELMLSRVLAREPHNTRALELSAWLECFVRGRVPKARQLCQQALQAPTSPQSLRTVSVSLLRLYASVLAKQGQGMCAATLLEIAVQLEPHDLWTVRRLAQVLQDRDAGVAALLLLHARRLEQEGRARVAADVLDVLDQADEADEDTLECSWEGALAQGRERTSAAAGEGEDESSQVPATAVCMPARCRASSSARHGPEGAQAPRLDAWPPGPGTCVPQGQARVRGNCDQQARGRRRGCAWKTLFHPSSAGRLCVAWHGRIPSRRKRPGASASLCRASVSLCPGAAPRGARDSGTGCGRQQLGPWLLDIPVPSHHLHCAVQVCFSLSLPPSLHLSLNRSTLPQVTRAGLEQHLRALQRIADANGGTRAMATPGHRASLACAPAPPLSLTRTQALCKARRAVTLPACKARRAVT